MGRCKLWLVFLLRLIFCSYNKGLQKPGVKTIGKETDLTPACNNVTLDIIIFIICKIRTERSRDEECHLRYTKREGLDNKCDSRFSLVTINQTVFLQLNNLSPENSGNYTCDCSYKGGTNSLQLNITVEDVLENENEDPTSHTDTTLHKVVIGGVSIFSVIITGGILGVVYRKISLSRRRDVNLVTEQNTEAEIEPYSTFMQRENSLYLTSIIHTSTSTNNLNMSGTDHASLGAPL